MNHIKSILEHLKTNEGESDSAIQALIDTKFSSSDEENGKAAQILKGLFFSEDPKAKKLIAKLDNWFSSLDVKDLGESESEDDENSPLAKTMIMVQKKANAKGISEKATIYQMLCLKFVSLCEDNAAIKVKARRLLLDQIKTNFKDLDTGV